MTKHVVVTGASTGIGAACALHLDALEFRVFAGIRRPEDGEKLKERSSNGLTPVLLDVTDEDMIAEARETVAHGVGDEGLQGLVNNAGIVMAGPLELLPIHAFRTQFEVNVIGQLAVTQAFLPLLRAGRGRIVNMSSITGRLAFPLIGAYAASKFALEALSDALRMELKGQNIPVSVIEPGAIATPIWERSRKTSAKTFAGVEKEKFQLYAPLAESVEKFLRHIDNRAIPPEAVARAVEHALCARRPRTRYRVGMDAKIQNLFLRPLPDRLRDWLVAFSLRRFSGAGEAPDKK